MKDKIREAIKDALPDSIYFDWGNNILNAIEPFLRHGITEEEIARLNLWMYENPLRKEPVDESQQQWLIKGARFLGLIVEPSHDSNP